jgi:hypothetical protein
MVARDVTLIFVGWSERACLSLERGDRSLTQLGRRAVGDSIEQSEIFLVYL